MGRGMFLIVFAVTFVNVIQAIDGSVSYCDLVKQHYSPEEKFVSQNSEPKNITVYWDNNITRAAAALLLVTLRDAYGYQQVQLQLSSNDSIVLEGLRKRIDEVQLTPFTSWSLSSNNNECTATIIQHKGLKIYFHISKHWRKNKLCSNAHIIEFYEDTHRLTDCGFLSSTRSNTLDIFYLNPRMRKTAEKIKFVPKVAFQELSRANFREKLNSGDRSFLFVDYDRNTDKDINIVQYTLNDTLEQSINLRVDCLAKKFAPQVFEIAENFAPSLSTLKKILEKQSDDISIEETTCLWVLQNNFTIIDTILKNKRTEFKVGVTYCDEFNDDKSKFIIVLGNYVKEKIFKTDGIDIVSFLINCTDSESIQTELKDVINNHVTPSYSYIGLVIGGLHDFKPHHITKYLDTMGLPILLYDLIDDVESNKLVWLTNGGLLHLTLALQYFIKNKEWTEVKVLTESTLIADYVNNMLKNVKEINLEIIKVPRDVTVAQANEILLKTKTKKRSIMFVNTNNNDALMILSTAVELEMNSTIQFTWIVREWNQPKINLTLKHLTFSFWYQNEYNSSVNHRIEKLRKREKWPTNAIASIDALTAIFKGFANVFDKYPQARYDRRSKRTIEQFERSLIELSPIRGIYQDIMFKGHTQEETAVYVDEWYFGQRNPIAQFKVNTTDRSVKSKWPPTKSFLHRHSAIFFPIIGLLIGIVTGVAIIRGIRTTKHTGTIDEKSNLYIMTSGLTLLPDSHTATL